MRQDTFTLFNPPHHLLVPDLHIRCDLQPRPQVVSKKHDSRFPTSARSRYSRQKNKAFVPLSNPQTPVQLDPPLFSATPPFSWFRPPNNNLHGYVTSFPVGTSVLAQVTFVYLHSATWSSTHRYRVAYNSWSPTIRVKSNHSSFFILHSTLLYSSFNPSLLIFWIWPI